MAKTDNEICALALNIMKSLPRLSLGYLASKCRTSKGRCMSALIDDNRFNISGLEVKRYSDGKASSYIYTHSCFITKAKGGE